MTSSPARTVLSSPPQPYGSQTPTQHHRPRGQSTDNDDRSDSDSDSSRITALSLRKQQTRSPPANYHQSTPSYSPQLTRPTVTHVSSNVSGSIGDLSRDPRPPGVQTPPAYLGHRARQHSQGFFEPSLPTASHSNSPSMSSLSASQIAAQAAMHAQHQDNQHNRKRSTTIPEPGLNNQPGRRKPSNPSTAVPSLNTNSGLGVPGQYQNGVPGGQRVAATAAANTVFPRSPLASPSPEFNTRPMSPQVMPEKEAKPVKEKSKMKLFSKPKSIGISRDKDADKRLPALPSPNRPGMYSTSALPMNQSTTSLIDHKVPAPSIYSLANASTSTLVPSDRLPMLPEKEKEKHRHHFLSRQKHKLKHDDHSLPLSSASSNSKPTDPHAPQPLYNFAAPNSPGHSSTFAQSMSGLDLRHGGRALRQKKKEEKAANAHAASLENVETAYRERDGSLQLERSEWPGPSALSTSAPSNTLLSSSALALDTPQTSVASLGSVFGVPGMTPDDAWPLIKARVLLIFEGEDPRPPIEDFNALVSVHIRRCIQRQAPTIIIEDLAELLQTGFLSLDQTLRHCPDDRLVPKLVDMWTVVLYTILPFVQAVFLPLDMEFKGKGIMNPKEAAGFWGASLPNRSRADSDESRTKHFPTLGEDLDVRRLTLLAFRDIIILPRNDALMAIFSRLSLENINAGIVDSYPSPDATSQFSHQTSPATHPARPGTSTSLGDTGWPASHSTSHSHNSASNILESTSTSFSNPFTSNSRSRATSNTSAGSFHSLPSNVHLAGHGRSHSNPQNYYSHQQQQLAPPAPPPPPMDTAKVMETVARMLQCVSILIGIRSGDDAQGKMEKLAAELKYNWFGRGRTGRNRRGFVGRKGVGLGTLVRVGEGD